jgi:tetratricopeptide (TPR) repeat protein
MAQIEVVNEATSEVVSEATQIEVVSETTQNEAPKNEVIVPSYSAPLSPAHQHNNIILLLMIKNEERIIQRCLSHALPHVDAISILDTGSTDHTIERCQEFLSSCGKPFQISVEPFKNFGYNRTVSFQKAQQLCQELKWDPEKTYAMAVDADMNIVVSSTFKTFHLTSNGYTVIQANGHIKYFNTRFMKCGYPWKCIGATHEYWSGDPTSKIPYEVFYIDDKNDGGCKSDKFERDVRLLTEEIIEDPKNARAHFYLGQSLKDLGRFKEAIVHFKRRIELGGWYEEVWYAHYQIAKCHEFLKDIGKMELWMNRAFTFHPRRSEPLYHMTRYFREVSQHHKAYHYYLKGKDIPYPRDDVLFIEDAVYNGMFDYENTILACYVNGKTRHDSLYDIVSYINRGVPHYVDNVWDNMHYYIESLLSPTYRGTYTKLSFPQFEEYKVSSCCVVPYTEDRLLMNTRYVNYSIDHRGCYHMRSPDGNVKTRNGMVFLNSTYFPTEEIVVMNEELPQTFPSNVDGLEDVRLFTFKGQLHFSASSKNLTPNGNIVIAIGEYRPEEQRMTNIRVIHPPHPTECEKNWIAIPETSLGKVAAAKDKMNFIYGWNPLEIGAVSEHNQLVIHTKYNTPTIFSRFRGSSPLCEFDGKLWCVTHYVKYSTPRVYYHSVVQFNRETMKPEQYSPPFCFRKTAIEYCLGFHIRDGSFCFFFSENDTDPGFITIPHRSMKFLPISM